MNIAFVDQGTIQYDGNTVNNLSLGGTESSTIYLSEKLSAYHNVVVLNSVTSESTVNGVRYLPKKDCAYDGNWWQSFKADIIINLTSPQMGEVWKILSPSSKLIVWSHLDAQQPASSQLGHNLDCVDMVVAVSQWHEDNLRTYFKIPDNKLTHIKNGVNRYFENLFESPEDILKTKELKAMYTSAPQRGLEALGYCIPYLPRSLNFEILSSMSLYRDTDSELMKQLINAIKEFPNVKYSKPVSQKELASKLKTSAFLTYPCISTETFCLSVFESLAAGCEVITTDIGALKETSLNYGKVLPWRTPDREFIIEYSELVKQAITRFTDDKIAWSEKQFDQILDINTNHTWQKRVDQWNEIFKRITT